MQHKLRVALSVITLVSCTSPMHFGTTANAASEQFASLERSCDYDYLTGLVDQYLKALVAQSDAEASEHVLCS